MEHYDQQQVWDEIDRQAELEAEALRKARRHRSVFQLAGRGGASRQEQMAPDTALYQEHLTLHYTTCSLCGKGLDLDEEVSNAESQVVLKGGQRTSLFTKDVDICNSCNYLHQTLIKSQPLRAREVACD